MQKQLLTLILILSFTTVINAQDYKTSIGLRLGITPGFSAKHFIGETTAIEGMFTSRWHGAIFTALYEKQYRVLEEFGLSAFYGGGFHFGRWRGSDIHPWFKDDKNHHVIGLDAICGIEYFFKEQPVSISLDWKPEFNFVKNDAFQYVEGAITLRWLFLADK